MKDRIQIDGVWYVRELEPELETALQIVLVTQKFEPGLYHLENEFTKDWIKI
jgi:hypothetical protein